MKRQAANERAFSTLVILAILAWLTLRISNHPSAHPIPEPAENPYSSR